MSTDYSHSIRNRLFLVLSCDELEYTITNNALDILVSGHAAATGSKMLEEVLTTVSPINEIFSSVSITWVSNPFLCYPSQFTDISDQRKLFVTSNKIRPSEKLLNGTLNTDISVTYSVEDPLLKVLKTRFPNLVYRHEIESLYKYIQSDIKPTGDYLVLDRNESHCLLIAKDSTDLRLLNKYDVKELNDVFYFIMLAIEQLNLDIEKLSLYWIDNANQTPNSEIKSLFENYIQTIEFVPTKSAISTAMTTSIACG